MSGLGELLDNDTQQYWRVRNGYTDASPQSLDALAQRVGELGPDHREGTLLPSVAVGWQHGAGVTFHGDGARFSPVPAAQQQRVDQCFVSACSVAYSGVAAEHWTPLATLALDACYEATLWAAALSALGPEDGEGGAGAAEAAGAVGSVFEGADGGAADAGAGAGAGAAGSSTGRYRGSGTVFLTAVGGGVFGNPPWWIAEAVGRAAAVCAHLDLDVRVVHFRSVDEPYRDLVDQAVERHTAAAVAASVAQMMAAPAPAAGGAGSL
jgi:hypothetical protein